MAASANHDPSLAAPAHRLAVIEESRMPAALRELLCVCFPADVAVFSRTRS